MFLHILSTAVPGDNPSLHYAPTDRSYLSLSTMWLLYRKWFIASVLRSFKLHGSTTLSGRDSKTAIFPISLLSHFSLGYACWSISTCSLCNPGASWWTLPYWGETKKKGQEGSLELSTLTCCTEFHSGSNLPSLPSCVCERVEPSSLITGWRLRRSELFLIFCSSFHQPDGWPCVKHLTPHFLLQNWANNAEKCFSLKHAMKFTDQNWYLLSSLYVMVVCLVYVAHQSLSIKP